MIQIKMYGELCSIMWKQTGWAGCKINVFLFPFLLIFQDNFFCFILTVVKKLIDLAPISIVSLYRTKVLECTSPKWQCCLLLHIVDFKPFQMKMRKMNIFWKCFFRLCFLHTVWQFKWKWKKKYFGNVFSALLLHTLNHFK